MFDGIDTVIEGVKILRVTSSSDLRGRFIKFHPDVLLFDKLSSVAVSINPKEGTIRGLHFQVEPCGGKNYFMHSRVNIRSNS